MTDKFWIGSDIMEIFKLWLAARITFYKNKATSFDMYFANQTKDVLNSLNDNAYLPSSADIHYSLFVDELLETATK